MATPAVRLFHDDPHVGLLGVRFPVELRTDGVDPDRLSTWPKIDGRLEYVDGRLLYMPPCADFQQDVASDVVFLLRSWSETRPEFIVGSNEAGMKFGRDIRAADAAVWLARDAGERTGHVRSVAPLLAVEVAGEDEEERVLRAKARWYLERGVRIVWLVLPETREVVVVTKTSDARFSRADRLPPHEELPDLEPEVSRFFEQLDRRA